jgi:hypothetical protein
MPVYNGVGACWMPRWMRDSITAWYILDFDQAHAQEHDYAYWLNGESRAIVDRKFLYSMLGESNSFRQKAKAVLIYIMVRLFGGNSYRKNT